MTPEVRRSLIFACAIRTLVFVEPVACLIEMTDEVFAILETTEAPRTSIGGRPDSCGLLEFLLVIWCRCGIAFLTTGLVNFH